MQLKSSLLLHIDGTTPVAEDIGRQVFKISCMYCVRMGTSLKMQEDIAYVDQDLWFDRIPQCILMCS